MTRVAWLDLVDNSPRKTIQHLLALLFEKQQIEGCLVPLEMPDGSQVIQTLVTRPEMLTRANPLAPVMPINAARLLQRMTKLGPSQHKLALVLRPCETRALVELVKLKQANLENLLLISFDCFGAFPLSDYQTFAAESTEPGDEFLHLALKEELPATLRWNCQVCQYPTPFYSDLNLGFVGTPQDKLSIFAKTEAGEAALKQLDFDLTESDPDREKALTDWQTQRRQNREPQIEAARVAAEGPEKMLNYLSTCIRCLNCMTNCPVCYCKECFFNSSTFELDAERYFDWASQRGGIRMPNDTLFFHITRMTHMATACVACGACSEACPVNIEIAKLFTVVGERTQKVFAYVAGRSLDDELPLTTFKEKELEEFDG